MAFANCHLVELYIKVHDSHYIYKGYFKRDDENYSNVDVTQENRFEVIKKAEFCKYCNRGR